MPARTVISRKRAYLFIFFTKSVTADSVSGLPAVGPKEWNFIICFEPISKFTISSNCVPSPSVRKELSYREFRPRIIHKVAHWVRSFQFLFLRSFIFLFPLSQCRLSCSFFPHLNLEKIFCLLPLIH